MGHHAMFTRKTEKMYPHTTHNSLATGPFAYIYSIYHRCRVVRGRVAPTNGRAFTMAFMESPNVQVVGDPTTSPDRSDFYDTKPSDWVLPKAQLPPKKVLEPVQTFVANAIQEQEQEKEGALPTRTYRALVDAFRLQKDREMLQNILLALRTASNGNTLILLTKPKHARLMHNIVRLDPFDVSPNDYTLADAHLNLLMAIVSAKVVLVVPIMTSLWKMATAKSYPPIEMTRRVHSALATLMRLCPKGKTELFPIISSNAPYRVQPEEHLVRYYKQAFHVVNYLPSIQNQLIELIVDKSLEIDVEIKISDDGEATIDIERDERIQSEIFEFDDSDAKPNQQKDDGQSQVDDMANKLDSLLSLLFQFIESRPAIADIFPILLNVVMNSILITHKSKFVQFIILYACGIDEQRQRNNEDETTTTTTTKSGRKQQPFYRDFANHLIENVLDPYRATSTRQTAALYLASFVSRGAFVKPETVCEMVRSLLQWTETYMKALNPTQIYAADARRQSSHHSLFYTVCQSVFYIMCFRGKEAIQYYHDQISAHRSQEELDLIDLSSTQWTRLCGHALRPLNFCLDSVKTEFLQLVRVFNLIDAATIEEISNVERQVVIKRKKPTSIRTPATLEKERRSGGVGGLGRGRNPLDSFFPFDPFLLRQSHIFIEPHYNHWLGSLGAEEYDATEDGTAITVEHAESESDLVKDGDDEDEDDEHEDDDGNKEQDDASRTSNDGLVGSVESLVALSMDHSSPVQPTHEELQVAWSRTLKRSRTPSIETGSW